MYDYMRSSLGVHPVRTSMNMNMSMGVWLTTVLRHYERRYFGHVNFVDFFALRVSFAVFVVVHVNFVDFFALRVSFYVFVVVRVNFVDFFALRVSFAVFAVVVVFINI